MLKKHRNIEVGENMDNKYSASNVKINFSDKFVLQMLVKKYRKYLGYGLMIEDFNLPERYKFMDSLMNLNKAASPPPYEHMFILKCTLPKSWESGFKYEGRDIESIDLGEYKSIHDLICHDFRVAMENLIYSPMDEKTFSDMRKQKLCGFVIMYKIRDDMDIFDNVWTEEDKKDTEEGFDELMEEIYGRQDNSEWNMGD